MNVEASVEALQRLFLFGQEGISTLFLVRHAACEPYTKSNNYDPPLTSKGIAQANKLGKRLANTGIEQLLSSPALRAKQTADIASQYIKLTPQTTLELEEIRPTSDFLTFTKALQEIARSFASSKNESQLENCFFQLFLKHSPWIENRESLRNRAVTAVNSILGAYPEQQIAVITHGFFINAYLSELLGLAGDLFFIPDETSISIIKARKERRVLVRLNDSAHLSHPDNE